jgi:hypothetical protein
MPASAEQASPKDRARMAVSIADYIHDGDYGKSNPFKTGAVEVGAVVIESHWALADWRSADGSTHGQVSFFYECDHWNVGAVSIGGALSVQNLIARKGLGQMPAPAATKLAAELTQLESQEIAYLKPAKATGDC